MLFSELIIIAIISLLVLKPEDITFIIRQFKRAKLFLEEITHKKQLSKILQDDDISVAAEEINFYLSKIIAHNGNYDGDYSLDTVKSRYHELIQTELKKQKLDDINMIKQQHTSELSTICVIGAGVMGAGIAAIIANAKHNVILLDIATQGQQNRNAIADTALGKMQDKKSLQLAHHARAQFITIGNLEDDLSLIADCDLVIEAIVEKISIKHDLYNKIVPYLKTDAILASNTSTLLLKSLKANLPTDIRKRFMIMHFFNPPRYMDLLELVSDHETDTESINRIEHFLTKQLGKVVVKCNDTPGFIANRVGCFLLELVVRNAIDRNLNPAIIDKIFSSLFGLPSTGMFGLYDLIGHDVMTLISQSLISNLPENDLYKKNYTQNATIASMAQKGLIGRKGGGGFYRISNINGKKIKEVINFNDLSYSASEEVNITFSSISALLSDFGEYGNFFKLVLTEFYIYLTQLIPSVTSNTNDIDLAMRLGYGWKFGPCELLKNNIQSIGVSLNKADINILCGITTNHRDSTLDVILQNDSAKLLHYKNRLVFSINTKMNCLNSEVFDLLLAAVDYAEKNEKNLYIFSFAIPNFSAGADLKFITNCINTNNTQELNEFLALGQKTMMRLKYSSVNIISCAQGVALGGGCELLLHSDFLVMHQDMNAGLVEISVGVVPAFGGIKEMFVRSTSNADILVKNLQNVIFHNKSTSADYFVEDYCVNNYEVVIDKYSILEHALEAQLPRKVIPQLENITIPYADLSAVIDRDKCNDKQLQLISMLQEIINRVNITESQLLELEREMFMKITHVLI